jgi:glycosyltransferase involved in cell wall biosynthesis
MNRKKILHMVEDLKIGGLERTIFLIVNGLNRPEYDVEVWCLARGGNIAEELTKSGIPVKILGMNSYHKPLFILTLAQQIRKEHVDILHTHGYFAGTFGRLAALFTRVPVIITHVHSTYYNYKRRNILIERFLAKFTDRIICVSRAVQDFVVEYEGIPKSKTTLIYNAARAPESDEPYSELQDRRASLGFAKDDIVITIIASLTENKGHRILIDAFRHVFERHPEIRLMIVGDGPLRNELKTYVKKMEFTSEILFIGQTTEVFSLLRTADLCVLPSIEREGLGIALIEAMAASLPIVGTNLGGIPEVIEDKMNGLLVAPGDVHGLASAMEMFVRDKGLREQMGKMGRRLYEEKFTVTKMIQNVELLYDELAGNHLG